jgi:hypothetical protein
LALEVRLAAGNPRVEALGAEDHRNGTGDDLQRQRKAVNYGRTE